MKVEPLAEIIPDWRGLLASDLPVEEYETIGRHERSGNPLGEEAFVYRLYNASLYGHQYAIRISAAISPQKT